VEEPHREGEENVKVALSNSAILQSEKKASGRPDQGSFDALVYITTGRCELKWKKVRPGGNNSFLADKTFPQVLKARTKAILGKDLALGGGTSWL